MVPGMTDDAGQDPGTGGPAPGWAWDEAEIRRVGYQVVDAIAAHLTGIAARPVFRPFPAELAGSLAQAELPAAGTAADQLLAEAGDLVLGYPLGNGHPRFWAWVNSPPHVLGVLADALAAAANPSVAGGNHAAVHIEHAVVRWFCELAGLPDTAAGLMTSGGSMATLTALAIARDQAVRRAGGDVRASGLAGLAGPAEGTRRERVLTAMSAAQRHEQALFGILLDGLEEMGHVTTYGKAASRTATAYFTVAGHTPREVAEHLAGRKVNVWDGHNYAWELTGALGIRDAGSAVRAGLVHYNDRSDVDRLLAGVAELG